MGQENNRESENRKKIEILLKESAEEIEIPGSLAPESIERMLEKQKGRERGGAKGSGQRGFGRGFDRRRYLPALYGVGAAAVLFLCCYVMFRGGLFQQRTPGEGTAESAGIGSENGPDGAADAEENPSGAVPDGGAAGTVPDDGAAGGASDGGAAGEAGTAAEAGTEGAGERKKDAPPKQDAGDLYRVASDYEEVRVVLEQSPSSGRAGIWNGMTDFVVDEISFSGRAEAAASPDSDAKQEYSTTNLQVDGVDESDIIKTDGEFIYTVSGNRVCITDIRGEEMRIAGTVELPQEDDTAGRIQEIYVADGKLAVIASEQTSRLFEAQAGEGDVAPDGKDGAESENTDYYYVDTSAWTTVYTYSLADREKPALLGKSSQSGWYMTSRKMGDMVYLFSETYPKESADISSRGSESWVPVVCGLPVEADHIYLPEQGGSGLVISSVSLEQPDETVDNIMVINNYVDIYVSDQSVYLYGTCMSAQDGSVSTEIARFALEDGYINAAGAANVPGQVKDTFAVNEYGDSFRILTTDSGGLDNCLYLFDLSLKRQGALEKLARGERIYAARYFGDMVYFVTYRNVDPLFAVDLSDETAPKVLGELKITGYSDYLHLWDENTLFGLGYETDADTGRTKGLKIAMFDISDPAALEILADRTLPDANYSPALSAYKTALVDSRAGLIGFAVYRNNTLDYTLYDWKEGEFHNLLTVGLSMTTDVTDYRGLYVGDGFYVISPEMILRFDRTDGYKEAGMLVLE